jgi:hypothetical protein
LGTVRQTLGLIYNFEVWECKGKAPAWAAAGQFHYSWPRSNELLDLPIIDY